jgi:molybdopterin-binding protein
VTGADLTEVPPEMLFFSGGAGTVRGQPYQSLAIDVGGGNSVTAMITNASVEELGLAVGKTAYAIIKASEVIVGAD